MQKSITNNFLETQRLGKNFANQISSFNFKNQAVVLCLHGELGSGKTTFLQGFARGLEVGEIVNSPTFVIIKRFSIVAGRFKNFYHIDCYRLNNEEELRKLGFKDIVANRENIVAIEWADKIPSLLPPKTIHIDFRSVDENTREINIQENEQ